MLGFCTSRLGSRDEAEDALQSTFLNAHRALRRGVTPEAELPWLYAIANNVCLTRRRTSSRRRRVERPSDLGAVQDIVHAPEHEPADELIRLTDALADLPDNQRRAILLREWQGLSYREIAVELDLTQSAVETLIFRARRSLVANLHNGRVGLGVGKALAPISALFGTGVAVKAATAAVVVSGAVVVAAVPSSERPTQPAPIVAQEPVASPTSPPATVRAPRAVEVPRAAERPRPRVAPASEEPQPVEPVPPAAPVAVQPSSPAPVAVPVAPAHAEPPRPARRQPPRAPKRPAAATNRGRSEAHPPARTEHAGPPGKPESQGGPGKDR